MNRRQMIASMACFSFMGIPCVQGGKSEVTRYLSAHSNLDGQHYVSGFSTEGQIQFSVPLPGRGHAVALSPEGRQAVAIARRPGQFLLVFDRNTGEVLYRVNSRPDRHFYGHGVFSPNGRWFYTTENDFNRGRGVVVVRDVTQGYRQAGEFSAYGVGPHEIVMLPDGYTLVVANGGIQTHPDTGRSKLNLERMQPSLSYIDVRNGELVDQIELSAELHQNSIRHVTTVSGDQLCFVMQYQGSRTKTPPLIGLHRLGTECRLLKAPLVIHKRMRNYCGSVVADRSGKLLAVSSPKGGVVTFWDAESGEYLGHTDVVDGCGLAAGDKPGEFLVSSGQGGIYCYRVTPSGNHSVLLSSTVETRWDNHLSRVAPVVPGG